MIFQLQSVYPSGLNLIKVIVLCPISCDKIIIRLFSQEQSYDECIFSSTSTIKTCVPTSKNIYGLRLEHPS